MFELRENTRFLNTAKSSVKVRGKAATEQMMLNRPSVENGTVIHILKTFSVCSASPLSLAAFTSATWRGL